MTQLSPTVEKQSPAKEASLPTLSAPLPWGVCSAAQPPTPRVWPWRLLGKSSVPLGLDLVPQLDYGSSEHVPELERSLLLSTQLITAGGKARFSPWCGGGCCWACHKALCRRVWAHMTHDCCQSLSHQSLFGGSCCPRSLSKDHKKA